MMTRFSGEKVLKFAAAYNLIWGALIVLFPNLIFDLSGLERPIYPGVWQAVGMIVGVYGLGYWIASFDPMRHWPIILVGFLGKVFGPIGFLFTIGQGSLNWKFGLTIITNDLIWWIPFGAILIQGLKTNTTLPNLPITPKPEELMDGFGDNIFKMSEEQNVLLVLLRHGGCTFCRESLDELKNYQNQITNRDLIPIIVHMGDDADSVFLQENYNLEKVQFISDPTRMFYQAFGARRGRLSELFGPTVWLRGFWAGVVKRHGIGMLKGDGFQLGGVYLIQNRKIDPIHIPKNAADIGNWPDLLKIRLPLKPGVRPSEYHAQ
ncbi:MAG: AhpC/TSA family protein [Bdellovibrionales bacterium]